jgi:Fur family zinc uptake transcriptional regulator
MADAGQKPAPPTVYRALELLLAQGLVHKLETIHAFVGCRHLDHPHLSQFLICSSCGQVNEIEDNTIARGVDSAGQTAGFVMERPVVELPGTCARCHPGSDGREALRPSDIAAGQAQ